jgi:urease accessory protein
MLALDDLRKIGREGTLVLEYERDDHRTVLARSSSSSPWHLLPPIYLDESGCAYTLLVNPSGGMVGGDSLSVQATLGPRTHVLVSTPSANRVYRSLSESAVQKIDLDVGTDAVLEWMPDPTIPFAGAQFQQVVHVNMQPGSTLLFWDILASGRIASGERWSFTSVKNEILIRTASGSVHERYRLTPAVEGVGLAQDWNYVASVYLLSERTPAAAWDRLAARIGEILDDMSERGLAGVSFLAVPGLAVKVLAQSAAELHCLLEPVWAAARAEMLGLPAAHLRKY